MLEYKEWAKSDKSRVDFIAKEFGTPFMKALAVAFLIADNVQEDRILIAFAEEFDLLYHYAYGGNSG